MATLYIVATPIGNLKDITLRAIEVLQQVDYIAAEDTRHSSRLLNHYGIKQKLISLHEFNEDIRVEKILDLLAQNKNVAVISDAGTPLINDPGFPLVVRAHQQNVEVVTVPGPCAAIAALSVAGLPTNRFVFEGFLSPKGERRRKQLEELLDEKRTIVLYESVHRIKDLLQLLVAVFGPDRFACVARELTKIYETIRRDSLGNLLSWIETDPHASKGEFVVMIEGAKEKEEIGAQEIEHVLLTLMSELPLKQAVSLAQKLTKVGRHKLYEQALQLKARIQERNDA